MRRMIRWFGRSIFALAIAAALGFGGYQASGTTGRTTCEWNRPMLDYCADEEHCQQKCDDYYQPGSHQGICPDNCCICIAL